MVRTCKRRTISPALLHYGTITPQALNSILDDPNTDRYAAVKKLIEAGGGKLISMYSTASEGPGVLMIFDMPDPEMASSMTGVAMAGGAIHNIKLTRLMTQEEVKSVRQKARQLRGAYKPPGKWRSISFLDIASGELKSPLEPSSLRRRWDH